MGGYGGGGPGRPRRTPNQPRKGLGPVTAALKIIRVTVTVTVTLTGRLDTHSGLALAPDFQISSKFEFKFTGRSFQTF